MSIIFDRIKYGKETVKNPLYDNKYSFGRLSVDESKCSGCEQCKNICVVKAISIQDSTAKIDYKKCIYCRKCMDSCAAGAIIETHDYKLADIEASGKELKDRIYSRFKRSLVLRSVDTGSCNACMLELSAMSNTYYDISRYGVTFAASPRHADGIVVTGPVSINMKEALVSTYYAMSEPRLVIAVGACAHDGGIFKDSYGNVEELNKILPVDLIIPGCPPSPQAMIYGFLKLMDKI